LRTDRPVTDLSFGEISNGHISARDHPIHFMFGSMVGLSGSTDRMALFPVSPNPRPPSWKMQMAIFSWRIIRFTPCLVLGWGFRVSGSNGAISVPTKFNRYVGENNAGGVIRSVTM